MSIARATLNPPVSSAGMERALLRRIEAGVYAEHLLTLESSHDREELQQVAEAGQRAWQTLWLANLRLVAKLSHQVARAHRLPFDDVFQDGCLGLAEALMRFDIGRGWRFSTLAHEYIHRAVRASAARRAGELDGSGRRHRLRILLAAQASEVASTEHRIATQRQLAVMVGASRSAAASACAVTTALDELGPDQLSSDGGFGAVEGHGTDFLALLPDGGYLLRLRYGLGTRCHTQAEVAELLSVSASTVARMEQRALAQARGILQSEQCRLVVSDSS